MAFEACATSHYWARYAQAQGHEVRILPALSVYPVQTGHKTDENDALAVAEAAMRPASEGSTVKDGGTAGSAVDPALPGIAGTGSHGAVESYPQHPAGVRHRDPAKL